MKTPFVHLHLHTAYSLLDGACRIEPLVKAAQAAGMPAVAITDHGNMFGVVEFYMAARKTGIKPILGCEVYEAPGRRTERQSDGPRGGGAAHLVLLAADATGYANLIRLVTAAHLEGFYYKPRIDRDLLARHARGLIGLSACLKGRVAGALLAGDEAGAAQVAGAYAEILGKDNFFLELQDHGLPDQKPVNAGMVALARRLGLPLAATNDVHYLEPSHAEAHEALLCIQTGTVMSDPKRMRYGSPEFYFKSGAEMARLFADVPEALANTVEIARRCTVELPLHQALHYPAFAVPGGADARCYLEQLCAEGLRRRYGLADPAHPKDDRERDILARLHYEIGVIEKTGFLGYFLVVWDVVRFAREQAIPIGPGRGSGAASLVSYALGITGVDPLRHRLVFERFLNPERVSPPDFDIDFCQARRGEVIEYIKQKYGRDHVAQIITFGSLGAKSAIRDVGRVLEVPLAECDRLAKMVPEIADITLEKALETQPELKRAAREPNAARILKHALVIEGLLRNAGVHAAGVVIGDRPLADLVPLACDKDHEIITQFSKDYIEALGLLKADILGLKTLTVMDETVKLVRQTRGVAVDLDRLPMDDAETFALLRRGDTVGVFQLESSGMRNLVRQVGLDRIEDLIAMIALYRPGSMQWLDRYVDCKANPGRIVYDDPRLEPILAETYGIMVYQEQVQQAAQVLAGYSLGQGDILRKAMAKKMPEEMQKQRAAFIEGCRKTAKMTAHKAEKIFETISKFAFYGFNKAHSTGYAVIAFQTAYLKAHFPGEFMAALISSEISRPEKMGVFLNEARAMGFDILPPDVNVSGARFIPEGARAIRYGLAGIKNIGEQAAASLVQERAARGPFRGLMDACDRLDPRLLNRKTLETLVRCGAFDAGGLHRARLFQGLDLAMGRAAASQRDRQAGQVGLFDQIEPAAGDAAALPDVPPWRESELLTAEKDLLGIYLSGHPLTAHAKVLQRYRLAAIADLSALAEGALTRVGGVIVRVDKRFTKDTKEPYAAVQIEDLDGLLEALLFTEAYRQYQALLTEGAPVLACGMVRRSEEAVSFVVRELYPLAQAPRWFTDQVRVHLPSTRADDATLGALKAILRAHPGPTPVGICILCPKGEQVFLSTESTYGVDPSEAFERDLQHLLGEDCLYLAVSPRPCRTTPERRWGNGRHGGPRANGR